MITTKAQIESFNRMNGSHAQTIAQMIHFFIQEQSITGATKHNVESILKLKHQTATSALSRLQDEGLIYTSQEIRGGCSVFHSTPANLIEEMKKKRAFRKYQEYLNHGKKYYNLPDEIVVDLTRIYRQKHNI